MADTTTIKIDIVGQLDPEAALFVMCMERASQFKADDFAQWASRVESLIEICENITCQRVMPDAEQVR